MERLRVDRDASAEPDTGAERHESSDNEIAALVIVREDGTCTVAWGRNWCVWEGMPGIWPNPQEAMRAVHNVVGRTVIWDGTEPHLFEGRVSTRCR